MSKTEFAIVLIDPKYPHNVGGAARAAACFGGSGVVITGTRVPINPHPGYRLPREERLKSIQVSVCCNEKPFELFKGFVPVAVEVRDNFEMLDDFEHPEKAVYVFGPEDGSLDRGVLSMCHRFVRIPTADRTPLNLAAAAYVVLYDRHIKARKRYVVDDNSENATAHFVQSDRSK